jgi:hypothetical protein
MAVDPFFRRSFPNIDRTLHMVAVRVNDELQTLIHLETWTHTDVSKMKELSNLLLMVRKTSPKLEDDAKNKPTSNKSDPKSPKTSDFDNLIGK